MNHIVKAVLLCGTIMCAPSLHAKTIEISPGANAQEELQEALILAEEGDTIALSAGKYVLTDGLSLDVDGVTIKGQGEDKTILDFTGQKGSGEGLLVTSDDVFLTGFAIENSKGDGIKSKGADQIVISKVRVEWTRGPNPENGAYGIYPVESKNVLVDGVQVYGASDAGIYVGQSQNIIVRYSIVKKNVAGIEIENSYGADVFQNLATENTGGILVFDLPDIPQQGGKDVRVFNNFVHANNTANFAPEGNIVGTVPAGTGVMVMSSRNVEIFENLLDDNATGNILIVGYPNQTKDENYNPRAIDIRVFANRHGKSGYKPGFPGGDILAAALGGSLPPIIYDGTGENIQISDKVPAISLNISEAGRPLTEAQPTPYPSDSKFDGQTLQPIILPAAMEDKIFSILSRDELPAQ